jgi:probable rRNA maturation factor
MPLELNSDLSNRWILDTVKSAGHRIKEVTYNFVSREKILEINNHYLKHNYPTDIITFDYSEEHIVSGEVFICPAVVKTNAAEFGTTYKRELYRVLIHGILHLMGINDGTEEEKSEMRMKEDECLNVLASYENQI